MYTVNCERNHDPVAKSNLLALQSHFLLSYFDFFLVISNLFINRVTTMLNYCVCLFLANKRF